MIRALAEYEKRAHQVTATEEQLRDTLFGIKPAAEALLAHGEQECAGFAVFFATYSTFLAPPGRYLEDLYLKLHLRGHGIGLALLRRLAGIATERGCGRVEWEGSIGTSHPSSSIRSWAPCRWISGQNTGMQGSARKTGVSRHLMGVHSTRLAECGSFASGR